jgi:hypothetical protein
MSLVTNKNLLEFVYTTRDINKFEIHTEDKNNKNFIIQFISKNNDKVFIIR